MDVKDAFGQLIECGDTVVYCVRSGSTQIMNMAEVTEITTQTPRWEGDDRSNDPLVIGEWLQGTHYWSEHRVKGEQVRLIQPDNMVVIRKASTERHPEWEACRRG